MPLFLRRALLAALVLAVVPLAFDAPRRAIAQGAERATVFQTFQQTVQAAAYSTGNIVGSVQPVFLNVTRANGWCGLLYSVVLRDNSGTGTAFDIIFLNAAPTAQTDKTAIALTKADNLKVVGTVSLSGPVLGAASTMATFTAPVAGFGFCTVNSAVYALIVARATTTFAATDDVSLSITAVVD